MATKAKSAGTLVQLNVKIPSELKKAVQKLAVDEEVSLADLVAEALRHYMESQKDPKR